MEQITTAVTASASLIVQRRKNGPVRSAESEVPPLLCGTNERDVTLLKHHEKIFARFGAFEQAVACVKGERRAQKLFEDRVERAGRGHLNHNRLRCELRAVPTVEAELIGKRGAPDRRDWVAWLTHFPGRDSVVSQVCLNLQVDRAHDSGEKNLPSLTLFLPLSLPRARARQPPAASRQQN